MIEMPRIKEDGKIEEGYFFTKTESGLLLGLGIGYIVFVLSILLMGVILVNHRNFIIEDLEREYFLIRKEVMQNAVYVTMPNGKLYKRQ